MTAQNCAAHRTVAAQFRCDGCGRLLCGGCVREGHRLLFCVHCGERALPLAAATPATTPDRRRAELVEHPYHLADALRYVARGSGKLMLPAYVVTMVGAEVLPLFGGVIALLVSLLIPGLLFEIVRSTAAGDDVLPEWPDYTEL